MTVASLTEKWNVGRIDYEVYQTKKDREAANDRRKLKVTYHREGCWGHGSSFSEYVCVEHDGFAGVKAEGWVQQRLQMEVTFASAAHLVSWINANKYKVRKPHAITINKAGNFPELTEVHWEREPGDDEDEEAYDPVSVGYQPADDDEPPF